MNFKELVDAVAGDLGNRRRARKAIQAVARGIFYGLAKDGRVAVKNLGVFRTIEFKSQFQGQEDQVQERHYRIVFRSSESVKRAMKKVKIRERR